MQRGLLIISMYMQQNILKWCIKYSSFGHLIPFRFTTKNLADKIKGLQGGQTVDISGLMNLHQKKSE